MSAASQGDHHTLHWAAPDDGREATERAVGELVEERFASRLAARDHTLWGPEAEDEAGKRLAWVDLASESRPLVAEILALRDELRAQGLDRIVLCGMGGSSLAPEVICATAGVELVVLDSSDPDFVRSAVEQDLARTVAVVASKSGGTVETDSQKRAFEKAFADAGIPVHERMIVVTDPDSPFDVAATEAGYRVFRADPEVGGRFSALSAFGLVPSGLAGGDIGALLDDAAALAPALSADSPDNPALLLGALLGTAARGGTDKMVLVDAGSGIPGFGDWAEQLVAESTGKEGVGILPVVVDPGDPNHRPCSHDSVVVGAGPGLDVVSGAESGWYAAVDATLGGQVLLWEYATSVAGRLLGINPFDQPDVESAKAAAREMLGGAESSPTPVLTDGPVTVYASEGWLDPAAATLHDALDSLVAAMDPDRGYIAVQAYLDRHRDAALEDLRDTLAARTRRPVTFGWGPRFLHSTGQYHKGGPSTGVFLQVTSQPKADLAVPDQPFTFHEFLTAQAVGDGRVLAEKGRPVLRLHLSSPDDLSVLLRGLS